MKLAIKKQTVEGERTTNYEIPDDFYVDELFCQLNKLPPEVSDEKIQSEMTASKQGLTGDETGRTLRFCDYRVGETTLSEIGFTGAESYTYSDDVISDRRNGAA